MRDLEIRGAGNILGAQQHGHMEAVGYEMYLKTALRRGSGGQGRKAGHPGHRVPGGHPHRTRTSRRITSRACRSGIDIYKKIASVENDQDALDLTDELIDRFGDPPESVKGLIDVSLLRNKAASLGIKEISQRTDSLLFYPEVVDMEAASRLAANLKGRVMLNAGAKPYLAVRVLKGEKPVDTMRLALDAMSPDAPRA